MVTFEDFFAKKKIDLKALKDDNQELYQEFYAHYHVMGEKSFDHTKKFWFNKLRKSYKLHEPEQLEKKAKPESLVDDSTASPVHVTLKKENTSDTETSKPAGFKPRFKSSLTKTTPSAEENSTQESTPSETTDANKPAGFKPRFKAGVTKTTPSAEENSTQESTPSETTDANKPAGFKPRFKAGITQVKKKDDNTTDN